MSWNPGSPTTYDEIMKEVEQFTTLPLFTDTDSSGDDNGGTGGPGDNSWADADPGADDNGGTGGTGADPWADGDPDGITGGVGGKGWEDKPGSSAEPGSSSGPSLSGITKAISDFAGNNKSLMKSLMDGVGGALSDKSKKEAAQMQIDYLERQQKMRNDSITPYDMGKALKRKA